MRCTVPISASCRPVASVERTRRRTLRPRRALASRRTGVQRGPGVARPISCPLTSIETCGALPALRAHPERERRGVARDLERRAAQQEVARLGRQRGAVRTGGQARRRADVEDEPAGGRLGAAGSGDVDATAERHHGIEHERDGLAADRRRRERVAPPRVARARSCRAPRCARRSARRRAASRAGAGRVPRP